MNTKVLSAGLLPLGIEVFAFSEIDSTSSEARRCALAGQSAPALFIAESQTAGRGRMGRSFFSPKVTGLYMSLLFSLGDSLSQTVGITCAASVAAVRAIRRVAGTNTDIKWVNDIYLNGRKIAGILAESFFVGERRFCVVGIGVNISTAETDFPIELRDRAGSLMADGDIRIPLAEAFARELWALISALPDKSFMDEYRESSAVLGKKIVFAENGIEYRATAKKVFDDGSLEVWLDSGEVRVLSSGEISLRIK